MVMTLSGIVTEVREVRLRKTPLSIATTEYPPNVEGIVIAPPLPLYPVIVTTEGLPLIEYE